MENKSEHLYKEVDGKMVRKESNVRDPKKNYKVLNGYTCELTDKEEREYKERQVKWREEEPLRKKEEEKRRQEGEEFIASLKYETKFVGFFDILGWADAVKDSLHDIEIMKNLGLATSLMRNQTKMSEWKKKFSDNPFPGNLQIVHFSDSLVVSTSADFPGKSTMLSTISFLSDALFQYGFLLRGGITKGEIYHKDSLVFGPALNRAYELESKHAISPRIILEKELGDLWGQGDRVYKDGKEEYQFKTWRLSDDYRFYDFLQPMNGEPFFVENSNLMQINLTKMRLFVIECLEKYKEEKFINKYIWLAEYFNEVLEESGIKDIAVIDVDYKENFHKYLKHNRKIES